MNGIMNRAGWVTAGVLALLVIAAVTGLVRAGSLDPPGTPGPTAGVLRPGTPIASLPYTISQPGYYYLTGNLTMTTAGADGITVNSNDVTLDLGGFVLNGGGTGRDGVNVGGGINSVPSGFPQNGITIRNGTTEQWTRDGFNVFAIGGTLEDIHANNNQGVGIAVEDGSSVSHCSADQNSLDGMDALDSTVTGCAFINNSHSGVVADESVIEDCVAQANTWGILVEEHSTITHTTVTNNGSDGIRITGAGQNGAGGSSVTDNTADFNGTTVSASGIYDETNGNRIAHNNVSQNDGDGIQVGGSFNTIDQNSVLENSGAGAAAIGNAGTGIAVGGSKNTVVNNSSLGNVASSVVTNYLIGAGNNDAPVSSAASATDPWANTQ